MNAQQLSMKVLEQKGFKFLNWIPAHPDADGNSIDNTQTAVMVKRLGRFGREYQEVEPDGTINGY